jgi:hypothetical protein
MKTSRPALKKLSAAFVLAGYLPLLTIPAFAIEDLKITVPETNAVLSWPSDPSESYIIQYRHALTDTNGWATLEDFYPADFTTNITYFVDPNPIEIGTSSGGGTNTGGGMPLPGGGGSGGTNGAVVKPGVGFYRVVRDGVHLVGITNDQVLSGIVKIPVELGNNYGYLSSLSILEDNVPIGNSSQDFPIADPHTVTLNTTILPNGVHQIYGNATWQDTNGAIWEADAPVISVTVSNEISFENWMPTYGETGNTLLFSATSAHPDTDWQVLVYNAANAYLGYFSGHTYDGDITFYWDYSGTQFTNSSSFHFEVVTEYIDPPSPPTYKVTDPWPTTGRWAMACQHAWDSSLDPDSLYQQLNGFVSFGNSHGGVYPSASGDGSPYALAYDAGTTSDSNWSNFRTALFHANTRNMVYFGHGDQNGIGSAGNTNRYISAKEIATKLHIFPPGQTNRHAFRFVFVDACSTGIGMMPESFGILHKEDVKGVRYISSSTRFSAYVGWPEDKMIGLINGRYPNYDHVRFIQWIQFEMLNGRGIKDAIINASRYPDVHGSFGENDLKVFGYWDLTIGSYNN